MKMLFLLFASVALAQNACYYGANKRAGSAIIPCSSGDEIASCCQLGDLCLADAACWNPQHNVTYLYGCTDPTYTDASCPYKCGDGFTNAPYVGLDYCSNTTRNEWSCTKPQNDDPTVNSFGEQQCYNDSIIAFAGPSSLQPILSLPTNAGGSTLYFSQVNPTSYTPVSGYTPTSTPRPTASVPSTVELVSTVTATGSKTNTAAGSTSTSTNAPSSSASSSGLSTGAKIGIGVGVAGGAIAIAAVVIAWMILRRRKSTPAAKDTEVAPSAYVATAEKKPIQTGPSELPSSTKKNSMGPSELPDDDEHHGTPAPTYTSWTRPLPGQQVHELPADGTK